MQTQDIEQAKQLISEARSIVVAPAPQFQKDSFPAGLALFYSLKNLNKNVNLLAENYPSRFGFLVEENSLRSSRADFLVSIKGADAKFSHLFYEKSESGIDLFLKTKSGGLNEKDIVFENLKEQNSHNPEDLIITIGIDEAETVEKLIKNSSTPIINIDNRAENEEYGRINLVNPDCPSFSEITVDLICQIEDGTFNEQTANSLLAGILYSTNNLQSPKLTPDTLNKITCLIEQKASLQAVRAELYGPVRKNSLAIFARILNKLEIQEDQETATAMIKTEDFKKTNSAPNDLKFALRKLTSGLFNFQNLLVLWEQNTSPLIIKGVFYSSSPQLVKKISRHFEARQKGESAIFALENQDIEQGRSEVLRALNR